jgi:predicted ATPase/Tfp pilus assembly protein PilF/DNA-binding XRE family transcriptional regulator
MDANNPTRKKRVPNRHLKEEREKRGWTHKDVADLIDLPDAHTVGRWERGESFPLPHYRQKLSSIFGKSLEELGLLPIKNEEAQPSMVVLDKQQTETIWKVPYTFTSFIGRDEDIATVCALLKRSDIRLVSLCGPGGVGKTRLSMQIAVKLRDQFAAGVCFISLVAVSDPALLIPTIAEALGIQESGTLPLVELVKTILREKQMLLILDNFEQVVIAAPFLEELLAECPDLKVLVTSREVLHLQAEYVFAVSPLPVPDLSNLPEPEVLVKNAAIALFVQRAQSLQPRFQLTQNNAVAIAELCVHLDGLPLAIELAAAHIKLFTPQILIKRLPQGLHILKSDIRSVPERHKTLYNTIKWSYDLLDSREQWLFRRLSVFVGGASLETIEILFSIWEQQTIDVLDVVVSLLNKSLLQHGERESDDSRFVMLETIREFGLECLLAKGELDDIQHTHAMYFLALVEQAGPFLRGAGQLVWLERLEQEKDNLRAALGWLIDKGETELALRFCDSFGKFCGLRGYWSEEQRWLKAVLELPKTPGQTVIRARVLRRAGHLAYRLRNLVEARILQEESIVYSRELGDTQNLAGALSGLGWVMFRQNDRASASQLLKESVEVARESGDAWAFANALESLGRFKYYQGKTSEARLLIEESVTLSKRLADKESLARILTSLVKIEIAEGNLMLAKSLAQESFELAQVLGTKPLVALALDSLGDVTLFQGEYERAKHYFEQRIELARDLGDMPTVATRMLKLAEIAIAQRNLTKASIYVEQSIKFSWEHDKLGIADALGVLGDIKLAEGSLAQAMSHYKEALLLHKQAGDNRGIWRHLIGLAQIAMDQGQLEYSAYLFGAAEFWLKPSIDMHPSQRENYEHAVEKLRVQLAKAPLIQAWSKGYTIASQYALSKLERFDLPAQGS